MLHFNYLFLFKSMFIKTVYFLKASSFPLIKWEPGKISSIVKTNHFYLNI